MKRARREKSQPQENIEEEFKKDTENREKDRVEDENLKNDVKEFLNVMKNEDDVEEEESVDGNDDRDEEIEGETSLAVEGDETWPRCKNLEKNVKPDVTTSFNGFVNNFSLLVEILCF